MANEKTTCYQCRYMGEVPGSSQISCEFDWTDSTHEKPEGSERGKKMGWFIWPWDYDPIWMIGQCKEFNENQTRVKWKY